MYPGFVAKRHTPTYVVVHPVWLLCKNGGSCQGEQGPVDVWATKPENRVRLASPLFPFAGRSLLFGTRLHQVGHQLSDKGKLKDLEKLGEIEILEWMG